MRASAAGPGASMRAFIAVGFEAEVQRALARSIASLSRRAWARDVRWSREANLHLTLRFLGEVAEEVAPQILGALETRLAAVEPFAFTLRGLFCFPTSRRPRVIAAGLADDAAAVALAAAVEEAVVGLGFAPEPRPYRAHVTLGRFRRPPRQVVDPARDGTLEPAIVRVDEVRLYRSVLAPAGARYSVLGRAPLAASRD